MPSNRPFFFVMRSTLVVGLLFLALEAPAFAQSALPSDTPKPAPLERMEEEMRAKRAISFAQKEHKENLNRAQQLSCLGAEIGTAFEQKNQLDREDFKKLAKVEKLAKSIRSAAGGSDDVDGFEKIPADLPSLIFKMKEMTEALKDEVEKTPRRVVSAAVIDQANVLLELIRRVRGFSSKT